MATTTKGKSNLFINEEKFSVDPHLLFQRPIAVAERDKDCNLQTALTHEMLTMPSSLFGTNHLMLKADKSQLADAIWKQTGPGAEKVSRDLSLCARWW